MSIQIRQRVKHVFQTDEFASLKDLIAAREAEVRATTTGAEETRLATLEKEIETMTARWQWRERRTKEAEMQRLQGHIVHIKSGAALKTFQEKCDKYRRASNVLRALAPETRSSGKHHRQRHEHASFRTPRGRKFTHRVPNVVRKLTHIDERLVAEDFRAEMSARTPPPPVYQSGAHECDACHTSLCIVANSQLICPQCGKTTIYLSSASMSSYAEQIESSNDTYQKLGRMKEWLEFSQGKGNKTPPPGIVEEIVEHMFRHRLTGLEEWARGSNPSVSTHEPQPVADISDVYRVYGAKDGTHIVEKLRNITWRVVRSCLQDLARSGVGRYSKKTYRDCYELSAKIAAMISGWWPPRMTAQQESQMRQLFLVAGPVLERHARDTNSKNLIGGYSQLIRAICLLLGYDEFLDQFPLQKGKNIASYEAVRRKIWDELGWEFIPLTGVPPSIRVADGTNTCSRTDNDDENDDNGAASPVETRSKRRRRAIDALDDRQDTRTGTVSSLARYMVKRKRALAK